MLLRRSLIRGLRNRKWIWLLLKTCTSIILFFFIFSRVDADQLLGTLRKADPRYLLTALGLYLLVQVFCAYRWKLLAQPLGFNGSLKRFVYYYYAGMFFNMFLPTSIGGDISRCYYLAQGEAGWKRSLVSVLADRGVGFLALIFILATAMFQSSGMLFPDQLRMAIKGLAFFLVLGLIIPFFLKGFFTRLKQPFSFPLIYWQRPALLFLALLLSILSQLVVIGAHMLIGLSLGLKIPWGFYFIFYPLAAAAGMLPVSLNGLGLREGTYMLLLSKVEIPWEGGMAFAVSWLLVLLSASLIGGLIWISKPLYRTQEGF